MKPEFSRLIEVGSVAEDGRAVVVEASQAERVLLAGRFELPAIDGLACRFMVRPLAGGGLRADGRLTARVRYVCVVSGDEFEETVAEDFSLRFVPLQALSAEIEVDGPDDIPLAGSTVDLGEAAAEQLALALDPYPRRADLPEPLSDGGVGRPSPFAKLKRPA